MAKKVLIKLKSKPAKPVRQKKVRYSETIEGDITLQYVLDLTKGIDPKEVIIDYDYYYDYSSCEIVWHREETDEEFKVRMDDYLEKKKKYDKWYKDNKELVDQEIERRAKEEAEKKLKEKAYQAKLAEKEQKKPQKRIKELAKEQARLEKELCK